MSQSRLSGAFVVTAAQAVVLGLGWFTHPILKNLLGLGPYGVFSVVLSLQGIFGLVLTLGVPAAVSRFVAQEKENAKNILRQALLIQFTLAIIVGLVILVTSPVISKLLNDTSLTPVIAFLSVVLLTQSLYPIFVQYFAGLHQFTKQAILTTFYAIIKLAAAVSLIFFINVFGAFAGFAVGGLLAAILAWWWTKLGFKKITSALSLKDFLSFAGIFTLILIGLEILGSLDLLMVKSILSDNAAAGSYGVARTLARIPYILLQAIGFILLPSVSLLTKPGADKAEASRFIGGVIRYLIMLIVPGVALAAATSEPLVQLFFSQTPIEAAQALTILIVGMGAMAFYLLLANIAAGAGRARVVLGITISLIVISAVSGAVLIPKLGLPGAALQTTLAALVGLALLAIYTFKTFQLPVPVLSSINVIIATGVAVSLTYFWKASALTLLPQYAVVGLVYLAALWILREIKPTDVARLRQAIPFLKNA